MIGVKVEGLEGIEWADLWPRHIAYGECEAWCGGGMIVAITRPFTPDEDLVFDWVLKQDSCELYGICNLDDGRDLMVFDRTFTRQSRAEAQAEHTLHIRKVLTAQGVTPLIFSAS